MSKFSVGDRVVVVGIVDENGRRGEVTRTDAHPSWPIEVRFDGGSLSLGLCSEDELEFEHVYDALSSPGPNLVSSDEAVSHPSHYTSHPSGVECKDIIGHYPFFIGSAMKYLWRAGLKTEDPIEDLRKAMKNIEFEIERRMAARSGD